MRAVVAPMVADLSFFEAIPGLMDALPPPLQKEVERLRLAPYSTTLANMRQALHGWKFDRDEVRPAVAPTIPLHCNDEFLAGCGKESGTAVGQTSSAATTEEATTTSAETSTSTAPAGTVRFEVSGSGTAYSVDWDPGENGVADRQTSVDLPWSAEFPDPGDVEIYQVVVVGGENVGCRILINDEEVVSEPPGGSAHCSYTPE